MSVRLRIFSIILLVMVLAGIYRCAEDYIHEKMDAAWTEQGGFLSVLEYRQAKSLGISQKSAYDDYRKQEAVIKAKKAVEAQSKADLEEQKCRMDLECWGRKHLVAASICIRPVERLANYAHEWVDRLFFDQKFSHFRWKNMGKGVVTYIGDKIRFQNGFGAWQNHVYECDYDPTTDSVLAVRANPGRL